MFRYNWDFTTEFHHLSEAISLIAEDESFDEHTRKCADVIVQNIDEGSLNSTFEDALKNADLVDIEEFIDLYATVYKRIYDRTIESDLSDEEFKALPEPRYPDEERLDFLLDIV